jgi:hypothetical protein
MQLHRTISCVAALALALPAAACGDDAADDDDDNGAVDAAAGADAADPPDADIPGVVYVQIEHLARPGINEALLITPAFLAGYNATAPTFEGVPSDVLDAVVAEAQTVLKAIYLGSCLLNGALGLDAASGVKPAGITCHDVGPAIWEENALDGVTLTAASLTASQAYADKVAGQFLPDVMRIDTSGPSGYLTLCGDADTAPLLCGGRKLNEDVIDITYNYLINGAGTTSGTFDQVRALTGDGVAFSSNDADNSGNVSAPDPTNPNQFHGNVSDTFPYSAPPL